MDEYLLSENYRRSLKEDSRHRYYVQWLVYVIINYQYNFLWARLKFTTK